MPSSPHGRSDALVFFGATGDLAYKQVFPALAALVARGKLLQVSATLWPERWLLLDFPC